MCLNGFWCANMGWGEELTCFIVVGVLKFRTLISENLNFWNENDKD